MKQKRTNFHLQGCFLALAGAFTWSYLEASKTAASVWEPLFPAFIMTLLSSWFVVPIGVFLGGGVPRAMGKCGNLMVFPVGAGIGLCVALITATFGSLMAGMGLLMFQSNFLYFFPTMLFVCAIFVGFWSVFIRNEVAAKKCFAQRNGQL